MSAIDAAAAAAGLRRDWQDANGRAHRVDDAVLEAILARLDTTAPDAPFLSAEAGMPIGLQDRSDAVEIALEDGTTYRPPANDAGQPLAPEQVGYHRLLIGGREVPLAVAPRRCPSPAGRGWGVGVQIPSLRAAQDNGFGDLAALSAAADAFGDAGASALAISPTHALFPADPTRFSPYAPSTRLFRNVLLAAAPAAGEPTGDLIDWPAAAPAKLRRLRAAFEAMGDSDRSAFVAYRAHGGPALEAHARFDALHAALGGRDWRDWPAACHDPAGEAVARFAREHEADVAFHAWLQWRTEAGLAAAQRAARARMTIGLVADLAVGMDAGGSHGWSRRSDLLDGLTIGAPPDPLGPDGQNWGITTLDPFALARSSFAPFVETIRAAVAHAGGLRIDHALGLNRLWVIPAGATADEGAYLTMPGDHLKRIVAIEAHRANAIVIAEDLGTVPPGFRDDLARRGMFGMRVLPFERDAAGAFVPPTAWDADAIAMTGTHDTPTIAGWWRGRDIAWRRALGGAVPPDAEATRAAERKSLWNAVEGAGPPPVEPPIDPILAAVSDAPSPLAIVPLEDLVGGEEQPNIPGTIDEHPNWRRRMPAPTDALLARPEVAARTALLSRRNAA